MALSSNASFIPKSPSGNSPKARVTKRIYVLSYISYVMFFGVLILVGATYFYLSRLDAQVDAAETTFLGVKAKFSQKNLDEVRQMEKRLLLVGDLLDKTISPRQVFSELEKVVSSAVVFNGAEFAYQANDHISVTFSGKGTNFNDIIYQRDHLNDSELLKDFNLTSFDYSVAEGNEESDSIVGGRTVIDFTITGDLPISAIAYDPAVIMVSQETEVASEPRGNEDVTTEDTTDAVSADALTPSEPNVDTNQ